MSKDLDSLFTSGKTPKAIQFFSNRTSELGVFKTVFYEYKKVLERLNSSDKEPWNEITTRTNVLNYHGIGGVGKSTLLKALKNWVEDGSAEIGKWPKNSKKEDIKIVFHDFQEEPSRTPESILLSIRAKLGKNGKKAPMFDLLLINYWSTQYPGQDLTRFLAKQTLLQNYIDSVGLADQIKESATEFAQKLADNAIIGKSLINHLHAFIKTFREMRMLDTFVSKYPWYQNLLDECKDPSKFPYLASALSCDINNIQKKDCFNLIIFFDHYEKTSEQLDDSIRKIVWLMPNALFVFAGRKRLSWADSNDIKEMHGPETWPTIINSEKADYRQRLIGKLHREDIYYYLQKSLLKEIKLDDSLVNEIINISDGHPLHLDLIRKRCEQVNKKRKIRASDINLPFDGLVNEVTRGFSEKERQVLFAASMLDLFDSDLILNATSTSSFYPIKDLISRRIINEQSVDQSNLSWRLHSSIRNIVLRSPLETQNGWSMQDWLITSRQLVKVLISRILDTDLQSEQMSFLAMQLIRVVKTFKIEDSQLPKIAELVCETSIWTSGWDTTPFPIPGINNLPSNSPWLLYFCKGFDIIMKRQKISRKKLHKGLTEILAGAPNSNELDILRYYLSSSAKEIGDLNTAKTTLNHLIDSNSSFKFRAVHAMVHVTKREGDFESAQKLIDEYGKNLNYCHRLKGDLLWPNGFLSEAYIYYDIGFENAKNNKDHAEAALCASFQAWTSVFCSPELVSKSVTRFENSSKGGYISFAKLLSDLAKLVGFSIVNSKRLNEDEFNKITSEAKRMGHSSIVAYSFFAKCYFYAITSEKKKSEEAYTKLKSQCKDSLFYLVILAGEWMGIEQEIQKKVQWMDSHATHRWNEILISKNRNI